MKFKIICAICGTVQPLMFTKDTSNIAVCGFAYIDNTDVRITCNECGNETELHMNPNDEGAGVYGNE